MFFMALLGYSERLICRSGILCSSREEIDWRLSCASGQLSRSFSRFWRSAPHSEEGDDRFQQILLFPTFTYLKDCRASPVSMESTGVDWIPLSCLAPASPGYFRAVRKGQIADRMSGRHK